MDKFVPFAIGWAIGSLIVDIIEIILKICYGIIVLLWTGFVKVCKELFSLSKKISKKLYSSYKNRKTKINNEE